MYQTVTYWLGGEQHSVALPAPSQELINGIKWGCCTELFTPAFWVSQFLMEPNSSSVQPNKLCKGDLKEEVVFCMLGGFGITAELATAAFEMCKNHGLIEQLETSETKWREVLEAPITINGKDKRYRYPKQKATYISGAMSYLQNRHIESLTGKELRNNLLNIRGIGAKTAGWIARNYSDADDVAIIDIHILRAGVIFGLFSKQHKVEKDYFDMEQLFIDFCVNAGVKPSSFDCFLWDQMRLYGHTALKCYKETIASK